jgi:hypothetical protein
VVTLVDEAIAEALNQCAASLPHGENELIPDGPHAAPLSVVKHPRPKPGRCSCFSVEAEHFNVLIGVEHLSSRRQITFTHQSDRNPLCPSQSSNPRGSPATKSRKLINSCGLGLRRITISRRYGHVEFLNARVGRTPHSVPALNSLKFQRGRLLLLAMKTNLYEQCKCFRPRSGTIG